MSLEKRTILIIEDEPLLRELLVFDFKFLGATVYEAGSVDEALAVLSTAKLSLIISDIRLPGKDGVYLLNKIKSEGLSLAPVVLITGFADYSTEELKSKGAVDVFYKPFDIDKLVECAEKLLISEISAV